MMAQKKNSLKKHRKKISSDILKRIKLIATDVDGVLTNGLIYLDHRGEEHKTFHALDGLGIVLAKRSGLKIAFISSRRSKALASRARELGVDALYQNRLEKREAFRDLMKKFRLAPSQVCFIGDDLVDIPILKQAGFPVAVANAVPEVKDCARYITRVSGGEGAVREVIEMIMKEQGTWQRAVEQYL